MEPHRREHVRLSSPQCFVRPLRVRRTADAVRRWRAWGIPSIRDRTCGEAAWAPLTGLNVALKGERQAQGALSGRLAGPCWLGHPSPQALRRTEPRRRSSVGRRRHQGRWHDESTLRARRRSPKSQ